MLTEAKKYITKCILALYAVYTMQSSLQEYENTRKLAKVTLGNCLPLIKGLAIVMPLLAVLEDLKLDDYYYKDVTEILDNFYQHLAENQQGQIEYIQNNKATYELVDATYLELSGNSKTLLNTLQRVSLKKYWSYTNMGGHLI